MPSVFRSHSALKLVELDERFNIFRRARATTVLDLAAAPGGFSQVAMERMHCLRMKGMNAMDSLPPMVISVDQRAIAPLHGAHAVVRGNIQDSEGLRRHLDQLLSAPSFSPSGGRRPVEVVLHDGVSVAPGQHAFSLQYAQNQMLLHVLRLSCQLFAEQAPALELDRGRPPPLPYVFVSKAFRSSRLQQLLETCQTFFSFAAAHRPTATPSSSTELYIVAYGFRSLRYERYVRESAGGGGKRRNLFSFPPLEADLPRGKDFVWRCVGCQQLRSGTAACPRCR